MIHKTFVGRGDELAKIREWIKGPSGKLVLITGPGGIGKTSLLSKIEKEYSANQDFVVEYFDLAEQPMTMLNQALHMAESLGRENFPQFVHFGASSDVSDPDVLEKKALAACVREVSAYLESRQKKLLRITDTFEIALKYKLYGDDWAKGINERLKDIPNTFFIIAGRDKLDGMDIISEIYPMLQDTFGKNNILHLPLSGFDKVEMEDFFSECDKHRMIPQEMRKKLQLLTEGRPILLSLAVEWLQKNIPLPVLIEKSFPELNELFAKEDERTKLRNAFEFELISNMRQLKTPLDVAALYMAHIDRRMDSKLLSVLLDVKQDDAEEDLEELLQLPFVKEYVGSNPKKCALHDEMCVLVKKHAWEPLDNIGVERKRLTRMVIDKYYIPYIDMLKEQKQGLLQETQSTLLQDVESRKINLERWLLETETLYYSLKLGNEEGYRYFDQVYYDEERTPVRDQILIDELKRAGAYDRDKIALRRADELLRRGQPDDARRECLVVLKNENIEAVDRIHSFNILGLADFESAPHSAETYFKRSLELAQSKNKLRLQIIVHNNLGRLFRNMSRLSESIEQLKAALNLTRDPENSEMSGSIRNNLAWTYRLNGDLDDAEVLCSLSIAENRKRGQERPLAYAYLTKADIDRNKGDLQSAEQYAKQALDIFNRLEDNEGKIQVYRTLANILRFLHNYGQSFKYLEEGISLANTSKSFSLLASLYQLKGRVCRHHAEYLEQQMESTDKAYESKRNELFAAALDSLQRSIELSGKVGNRWESARSQLEIILIMLNQRPYNEADVLDLLNQVWNTAESIDDEFLKGYVYENYARIEMKNGNHLEAGHDFGQAAYYMANRTGVEMARAFDRLRNIILDSRLNDEQAKSLAKGVYETILQQDDYRDYPKLFALISMCEYILGVAIVGRER